MLAGYESKLCAREQLCHRKDKLFILFDDVTFNCEDKCCRLHIYVHDADFLLPGLRRELVRLSANVLPMGYSIDVNNDKGLSSECQFRKIYVKRVNGYRNIVDIMYDFDESFDYFLTVGGLILNRAIRRRHNKVSYEEDRYSSFAFLWACFVKHLLHHQFSSLMGVLEQNRLRHLMRWFMNYVTTYVEMVMSGQTYLMTATSMTIYTYLVRTKW